MSLKVLLIDTDLQANLTQSTIGTYSPDKKSIANCLIEVQGFDKIITPTKTKNLFLVPVNDLMIEVDLQLSSKIGRERILKNCLEATKTLTDYDIVLIDNPPYLSLITINSLSASDYYLIPVSTAYLSILGIKLLQETINKLRASLKLDLQFLGIVLTMYDLREKITKEIEQSLRQSLKTKIFNSLIRINTAFKSAPIEQKTIFDIEKEQKTNKGTMDFNNLSNEVLERINFINNKKITINE
jgi:chromosome partitioning protein